MPGDLVGPEAANERKPPRLVRRVQRIDQTKQIVGPASGPAFGADRILDAAEKLDMRLIEIAGAIANPEEMARGRVPISRRRIHAGHRLLVAEHERLVTGVNGRGAKLGRPLRREPAGAHETQALGDTLGKLLVAMSGWAIL